MLRSDQQLRIADGGNAIVYTQQPPPSLMQHLCACMGLMCLHVQVQRMCMYMLRMRALRTAQLWERGDCDWRILERRTLFDGRRKIGCRFHGDNINSKR